MWNGDGCVFLLRLSVVQRRTRGAMQRSKFDIGGADAGAGGMSISSGSGGSGDVSGMGASSSSSDASAMAQSTGSSGASSGSMCLEKSLSWAWSAAASATASRNSALLCARKRLHPVVHALFSSQRSQRSVTARAAQWAEDWRRHAFFMARPSNEPSRTERARVAHACVWMELLKLRKTVTSHCKCDVLRGVRKHSTDVWESGLHGGQGGLAGVDADYVPEKDPRLSFFAWVHTSSRLAASCKIVVVVAQPFSDVTWRVRSGITSRLPHLRLAQS